MTTPQEWQNLALQQSQEHEASLPKAHIPNENEKVILIHSGPDKDGKLGFTMLWRGHNPDAGRATIRGQEFRSNPEQYVKDCEAPWTIRVIDIRR